MSRIVLFGATGYTGRLTAEALVARGARPLLAARSPGKLRDLASELGDLEYQAADIERPETVADLVERGDVLLSTVGPFTRWGEPAVQAAIASGAHYLDSTGESPFIRQVFERFGGAAEAAGCGLVTAFGYDWVPGNLAGALALRDAGDAAARVDVGYFITGGGVGMSGGTRASSVEALLEPSYGWQGGRLVTERGAKRVRSFDVKGRPQAGVSVGTSEAFGLPRVHEGLREVNVYLGWFGGASRALSVMGVGIDLWRSLPVLGPLPRTVLRRVVKGSTGGPDAAARAQSSSYVVGAAYNAAGAQLAEVVLTGVNGYDFTGRMLAWGAERALEGGLQGTGALGPVDAFGLDALQAGAAEAGITRA